MNSCSTGFTPIARPPHAFEPIRPRLFGLLFLDLLTFCTDNICLRYENALSLSSDPTGGNPYGSSRSRPAVQKGGFSSTEEAGEDCYRDLVWSANGKHVVAATSSGRIYAARLCR